MHLMRRQVRTPVGIDPAGRSFHAVQLSRTRSAWSVGAVAALRRAHPGRPMDALEAARLRDVLGRQGFHGRDVVLSVPPEHLLTNILDLPPRGSGAPVDQIARMEIARMYDRDPRALEMACWNLPTPARGKKAPPTMVAACGHNEADAFLDLFEGQGLNVTALDVEACALSRALGPLLSRAEGMSAVLQLGWGTGLLLLLHGGVVVYQRDLPEAGVGRLHDAMTGQIGLDEEMADHVLEAVGFGSGGDDWSVRADLVSRMTSHFRAVVEEVRVSLSYAAHQYPDSSVEQLLLVGEGASLPGLDGHVASLLDVDVQVVRLGQLVECPTGQAIDADATHMTKAVGLARFFDE